MRELSNQARNVHLAQSNSGLVDIYLYDELKGCHECNSDSSYTIETKADFSEMLSLVNVQPYTALRWLFQININRTTKSLCLKNEGIFSSNTSCFLIKTTRYSDYKELKEALPQCNDLYLSILRRRDITYLFNGLELPQKLIDFVVGSYSKEPEKILELRKALLEGREVKTQKDIVGVIGVSSGSVSSLAFLLLADPPKSKSGLTRVLKKRMQLISGLSEAYGVSSLRNFLRATAVDMWNLKQLYNQGIIFNKVRDLPDCYDEQRLSKYSYCLERIVAIPSVRILKLCNLLESSWSTIGDAMNFLYMFYSDVKLER